MVEKKKRKKNEVDEIPSKVQQKIAKHIRFNTPKKSVVIQKEQKEYFCGSKAVDTLLSSKWGKNGKATDVLFKTREECAAFLSFMMDNKMFYRGLKVLKESRTKDEKKKEKDDSEKTSVRKRKKEEKDDTKLTREKDEKKEENETEKKSDDKKTKKRRYRIEIHDEQLFYDTNDIFVWLYDPLSTKAFFLGGVVLIGVVAATLFPLWPPAFRVGVYYVAVAAGLFVGSVLGTAFLRSVFFIVVWLCTAGRYHIWFLPNLLADVGFFESFKPWYTIDYYSSSSQDDDKNKEASTEKSGGDDDGAEGDKESSTEDVPSDDKSTNQTCSKASGDTNSSSAPDVAADSTGSEADDLGSDNDGIKTPSETVADDTNEDSSNNDYVMVDSPNKDLS